MSKDNLIHFLQAAAEDEQLKAKVRNAKCYEDFKSVARANGFELGDLDAEQAQHTISEVAGQTIEELADDQLALATGGVLSLPTVGGFSSNHPSFLGSSSPKISRPMPPGASG